MTGNMLTDCSLCLVTDSELCRGKELSHVVMQAVEGGVSMVQLREKKSTGRDFYHLALHIKKLLNKKNVPLIINDRVDVALAAGADGVHVGQTDLPHQEVRKMLGPDRIIGLSINTFEQLCLADKTDLDYLSLSPVFSTPTKTDTTEPFGIQGLQMARKMTSKPLITIGGINESNIRMIMDTGMDGVAVVSAICSDPFPEEAARRLAEIIRKSRETI